jgi:hypothetical protein
MVRAEFLPLDLALFLGAIPFLLQFHQHEDTL